MGCNFETYRLLLQYLIDAVTMFRNYFFFYCKIIQFSVITPGNGVHTKLKVAMSPRNLKTQGFRGPLYPKISICCNTYG